MVRLYFNSRRGYLSALFVFIFGVYLSLKTSDWSWFSRSGSLVVVLGIILTSTQIIENSKRLKQRQLSWEAKFTHDWATKLESKVFPNLRANDTDIWASGRCGLLLLINGTLVWGFGDLLGYLPFL